MITDIMEDHRDEIDFGTVPVVKLFRMMFLPTLIGMISMVVLNITDGAFVGHGVGSDALAAVNIAAPIFMITGGIGMMFGIGGSVVAQVHLSRGNVKAARINATQAIGGAFLIGLVIGVLMLTNLDTTCRLFGSSEELLPMATHYLRWIAAFQPLIIIGNVGLFMIRIDGRPKVSMWANLAASIANIFGDWYLIYIAKLGLEGAAIATSVSFAIAGIAVLIYMLKFSKTLTLYKLKLTRKSAQLTWRNLKYQMKPGSSAFLGEMAIASVLVVGNYRFIKYLGEDGVAAFSVACYCTPIIFMLGNAIVESVQPIISYGHGAGLQSRVRQSLKVAVIATVVGGIFITLFMILCADAIATLFLERHCNTWELSTYGLPFFSLCCIPSCLNLVIVGYYQSIERGIMASVITLMRGIIFLVPAFILLPMLFGTIGLWLALPVAELATLISCLIIRKK